MAGSSDLSDNSADVSARLRVDFGARGYDIFVGRGVLAEVPRCLPFPIEGRRCFIVSDRNVAALYAEGLGAVLRDARASGVETYVLEPGEESKSLAMLGAVLGWLLDRKIDRKSVIFALGGGVVGDLAGFAAAVVLRGVPYVQIPTTVLAQVDSAVGGKTAIDMPQGKNLVGAFYQPACVIADLGVLDSLPVREVRAGYAEIVKYGLLGDAAFFSWLEENAGAVLGREARALGHAVVESCRAKAGIVSGDELEGDGGRRALLNFGHTFGHAFEAAAGFDGGALLHGEAVAIGMVCAFDLSARLGLCPAAEGARVRAHLAAAGLPVRISDIPMLRGVAAERFIDLMHSDKKSEGGKIGFILARGIGAAFASRDVPMRALEETLVASLSGAGA